MSTSATELPRRTLLCSLLVALAVPGGLAACGTSSEQSSSDDGYTPVEGNVPQSGYPYDSSSPLPAATPIAAVADITDGGGVVVTAPETRMLVLTRQGDDVKAFDATCTHAGSKVKAAMGKITCPAHGSEFDSNTGAATKGPATKELTKVEVMVDNGNVYLV